jgi:hexokinase
MYLGEITRHVLLSLVDAAPRGLVFDGKSTEVMNTQWALDSSVMSEIENGWAGENATDSAADHIELPKFSEFDDGKLSEGVRRRLQRVKGIIVRNLGYAEGEVSLRDAAVCVVVIAMFLD